MTNIVLQHFDGDLRPLDELSVENISKYADMIAADYQLIRGKPFHPNLTAPCQKLFMLDPCWDQYDTVLMLDIDMFAPIGMSIDVFSVPGIGLYGPTQQMLHMRIASQYPTIASVDAPYWGGAIYKLPRDVRVALREHLSSSDDWMFSFNKPYHYEDEGIVHVLANRAGISIRGAYMDPKWCQCSFLPNPEKAGFIHIRTKVTPTGPKREKIDNYHTLKAQGIL